MTLAQTVIECRNCGGSDAALYVSAVAVAIAASALFISAREHRAFMRQLRARARFDLTFRVLNIENDLPDHAIECDAASVRPMLRLRLGNHGDRAASATLLNLLAPRELDDFVWCGPNGETHNDPRARPPVDTDDELRDAAGTLIPAKHLVLEMPRVTRKGANMLYFYFTLPLPEDGKEVAVPLRAVVQADEISDDVDEYEGTYLFRARRARTH